MLTWFTKASSCAQLVATLHHTFQYVYTTHSNMFTPRIPVCLHHAFIYANSCSPTMPEAPSCFMAYPFQGHWLHSYLFDNARSSYLAWFVHVLVVTFKTIFYGCSMVCHSLLPLSLLPCPSCCAFDSYSCCVATSVWPHPLCPTSFCSGWQSLLILTIRAYPRGIEKL